MICVFLLVTAMGTCRAGIDCPQGRMRNVNNHLHWGGTAGRVEEKTMGRTDERGEDKKLNPMRRGSVFTVMDGWMD